MQAGEVLRYQRTRMMVRMRGYDIRTKQGGTAGELALVPAKEYLLGQELL